MLNLIGKSIGRYDIIEELGRGGMAVVYKAYDTHLETHVAVKFILIENLPQIGVERALQRFKREAKALAELTHTNIIPIIDYGEFEGNPYLVMKYLPGGTLKQRLGKPIPWQEAVQLLIPVAHALEYAHKQGKIHRDVKPSNILITSDGKPVVSDFGIAKIIDEETTQELTGTSTTMGTPAYMAPEQVISKKVDHRADIYSLGIVFFEMLTGKCPFEADTPMGVLFKHANEPLPRPRQLVPGIPETVEKVLLKALAKKPEDRFQSMVEFADALESLKGLQTVRTGKKIVERINKQEKTLLAGGRGKNDVETTRTAPKSPKASRRDSKWRRWLPLGLVIALLGISLPVGLGLFNLGTKGQGPLAGLATKTSTDTQTQTPTSTLTPTFTSIIVPSKTFLPTSTFTTIAARTLAPTFTPKATDRPYSLLTVNFTNDSLNEVDVGLGGSRSYHFLRKQSGVISFNVYHGNVDVTIAVKCGIENGYDVYCIVKTVSIKVNEPETMYISYP